VENRDEQRGSIEGEGVSDTSVEDRVGLLDRLLADDGFVPSEGAFDGERNSGVGRWGGVEGRDVVDVVEKIGVGGLKLEGELASKVAIEFGETRGEGDEDVSRRGEGEVFDEWLRSKVGREG
jgi:hypothetical protein